MISFPGGNGLKGIYFSILLAALILLPAAVNRRIAVPRARPVPRPTPASCPLQTPEEWQQFLERYADSEKWIETCEDSTCDAEYFAFVRDNVRKILDLCGAFIGQHEGIARCTENYRKFVPAWMRQHDDYSYGFTVDNHTYLRDQEAADKPAGMMVPPQPSWLRSRIALESKRRLANPG